MDGYRDLYRAPVSAGYYASSRYLPVSYALSLDPFLSAYARAPLDAYAAYEPELLRFHRDAAPLSPLPPRRRSSPWRRPSAQTSGKRLPPHMQNLAPKKTLFKKKRKGLPVEVTTPKKGLQQRALRSKPVQREQKVGKPAGKELNSSGTSLAKSLVKETLELHSLFRTGIDPSSGKKIAKPSAKKAVETLKQVTPKGRGQKRKADSSKKDEVPSSAKKLRAKKKKQLAKKKQQEVKKDEKPVISTPKAAKVEPPVLTEEEVEASLALQSAACKEVGEFLGIPENIEQAEKSDVPDASLDEAKLAEAQPISDGEVQAKAEEATKPATLSPEEEKDLEEQGYKFFSKFLEQNQDLRNLYLEKKDAGAFECLICQSIDPETSKKFTSLTNLVMHTGMRKLKQLEHRGYGRAICDVLGWESLRGPKPSAKQAQLPLQPHSSSQDLPPV